MLCEVRKDITVRDEKGKRLAPTVPYLSVDASGPSTRRSWLKRGSNDGPFWNDTVAKRRSHDERRCLSCLEMRLVQWDTLISLLKLGCILTHLEGEDIHVEGD